MENFLEEQQYLKNLNFIDFTLSHVWNSHLLIDNLRKNIKPFIDQLLMESDFLFDPQDLEHNTLFFLSTYNAGEITNEIIEEAVRQQYLLIKNRLLSILSKDEIFYIFRGLKNFYPDLNSKYRLKLESKFGKLVATGEGRKFEVEFKKIDDEKIISLFTGTLHYIHQTRRGGDTFALFFKGDRYPWAIETTELSTLSREYKREALLANGIHPDKAIELTRLYTLPGSPLNAISVLDKHVKRYYINNGDIEALFTRTMPCYSKSKSTTIAGGLNKVLCLSNLYHFFRKVIIRDTECWENVSRRWLEENDSNDLRYSHPSFALLPAVDVFMPIRKISFSPVLPIVKGKVIYFKD